MPLASWRSVLKLLWRTRHLVLDPWEEIGSVFAVARAGLGALAGSVGLVLLAVLALVVALLHDPWRTPALVGAGVAFVLALVAFGTGLRLLLVTLPRRVRAAVAWVADAPSNLDAAAREFVRVAREVEREDEARRR